MLDARLYDGDADDVNASGGIFGDDNDNEKNEDSSAYTPQTEENYKKRAAEVYAMYSTRYKRRFKWLRSDLFVKALAQDLESDARSLLQISHLCKEWDPSKDTKLESLFTLITEKHPKEKILIFTQFADTVKSLGGAAC